MRAFHACRPESVSALIEEGIHGHDREALRVRAHAVFGSLFPACRIDEEFDSVLLGTPGVAYLALDGRLLTRRATHYVIYGSEHLNGLAARLDRSDFGAARRHLATVGTPTILECQLTWAVLEGGASPSLSTQLAESVFESVDASVLDEEFDFTCTVSGAVRPASIIGHHHIGEAPDVYQDLRVVDLAGRSCDSCEYRFESA